MEEFTTDMQQSYRPFSIFDIDPSMEMVSNFGELNAGAMENPNLNFQSLMGFSVDSFFMLQQQQQQPPEFPGNLAENFPGIFHPHDAKSSLPVAAESSEIHDNNKRKAVVDVPESSSGNSSPPVSEGGIRRENSSGRGKRSRRNEKGEEKQKGVVHVRARRGQATDSHSLAERVRRGKINEKLKCLQGIVPGCYKTMGMAVMLDEIINYVQSLQNQVEFLSMKLTAASRYYDFSSETDAMEAMQRAKLIEAQKMQRLVAEEDQGLVSTQLIGCLDNTFGSYPSLPHNT